MALLIGFQNRIGKVPLGAKLKQNELPEGEYLVSIEDEFMTEEDNTDNLIIQEPTA
jgi:hypothetical protein